MGTFVGSVAISCVVLNGVVTAKYWHPHLGESDDKLRRLRQLATDVDVLFIGTSHFAFDINPLVFDATTAAAGAPTFSFNLGVRDMPAPEREMLEGSLASVPAPRLRYVFIEPLLNHTPDPVNLMSGRFRKSYNWQTVPEAVHVKLDANRPLPLRLAASALILRQFAVSIANPGVLSDILMPYARAEESEEHEINRGFIADTEPAPKLSSAQFEAEWRAGGSHQFSEPPWDPTARDMTSTELRALSDEFDRIKRLHAQPVVLVPPQSRGEDQQVAALCHALSVHFPDVPLLAYNYRGPDELYEHPEWWVDGNHMSPLGSEHFTRRLARDWLELRRVKGLP